MILVIGLVPLALGICMVVAGIALGRAGKGKGGIGRKFLVSILLILGAIISLTGVYACLEIIEFILEFPG